MKKLISAALLSSVIASGAYAASENAFYIKAEGGASILSNYSVDQSKAPLAGSLGLTATDTMKGKTIGAFGIGVGYYIMDNLRIELDFNYHLSPEYKYTSPAGKTLAVTDLGYVAEVPVPATTVIAYPASFARKLAPEMMSGFAKAYVDVVDLEYCKIFVGAGIGASFVKSVETVTYTSDALKTRLNAAVAPATPLLVAAAGQTATQIAIAADLKAAGVTSTSTPEVKNTDKRSINMAFTGEVGVSFDVADNAAIEVKYQYGYYGKKVGTPAAVGTTAGTEVSLPSAITAHEIRAGIRFSF